MPLLLVILAIFLVVFVVKVIIVLFTRPVDAIAMLTSWALNIVGLLAIGSAAVAVGYAMLSDGVQWDSQLIFSVVVLGGVGIAAFAISSWLGRVRLRREYRRHADAQMAAYTAAARQHGRR